MEASSRNTQKTLGFQGGGKESTVHYFGSLNFWIAIADSSNRYWNAFGLGNPFKDGSTIIVEINPPKEGIDRRISGTFIEDNERNIYMAHRGRVGGGRKGIGKKAFMAWYQGTTSVVKDGDKYRDMIVIGALDDKELVNKLAAFTKIVSVFKDEAVARSLR